MQELRTKIAKRVEYRTLYEQLAEEAAEFSKAALKIIRATNLSDNPTNIEENEAFSQLIAELQDVLTVWNVLCRKWNMESKGYLVSNPITGDYEYAKLIRWAERLALGVEDERSDT